MTALGLFRYALHRAEVAVIDALVGDTTYPRRGGSPRGRCVGSPVRSGFDSQAGTALAGAYPPGAGQGHQPSP